jgi:C4-dicarboxylate transporter, DctM subunit
MVMLVLLILLRVPIAIAMGTVGFVGYVSIEGWSRALSVLGHAPYDAATNYTLAQVPLFMLMGEFASRSGMSKRLFGGAQSLFFDIRASHALAALAASAGFGAICGSSLATAATMTRIAIPEMRRANYDDRLSTGSVAAGGTLGILIPPSIPLIIYGLIAEQSVPQLFAATLIPGMVLMVLYMIVVLITVFFKKDWAPPARRGTTHGERLRSLLSLWDVVLLFGVSIGGLYAGLLSPTEAAAVGAFGALVLGLLRGQLSRKAIVGGLEATLHTTASLMMIVICALMLSYFVVQTQLPARLVDWVLSMHLRPIPLMIALICFYVVLGCFLDGFGMMLITVPVFLPLVVSNGFDPVWFGVILVLVIELGLIHPPVGMNIFVIQAQAPEIPLIRIYQGILPFLIGPFVMLALMLTFPQIALWLPHTLFPPR